MWDGNFGKACTRRRVVMVILQQVYVCLCHSLQMKYAKNKTNCPPVKIIAILVETKTSSMRPNELYICDKKCSCIFQSLSSHHCEIISTVLIFSDVCQLPIATRFLKVCPHFTKLDQSNKVKLVRIHPHGPILVT